MAALSHNGRWVTLRSGRQPDGTWACDYTILEIGPTRSSNRKQRYQEVFSTREAAEAAAFEAAQAEIDARGPLT
jgi:hypothetical protein